ncbi:hypothetical protein HS088_TW11G00993 [Tripterygium wilfordii]|uniref:Uncharacterized protein n=1 Tax=Tripterygium wilfordii TaxID=458696 RepID=A0A7J7D3L3_TRIWF|nr:hypothetical protein HS088_TW11G00993 [Tripterygium wilfordii]
MDRIKERAAESGEFEKNGIQHLKASMLQRRYDWARTDKGVGAVGQVVSGRFYIDPPGLVERLNSNLSGRVCWLVWGLGMCLLSVWSARKEGRKIPEAMLKRICGLKVVDFELGISSDNGDTEINSKVTEYTMSCDNKSSELIEEAAQNEGTALIARSIDNSVVDKEEKNVNREEEAVKRSSFCHGEEERERFNRILTYYPFKEY